jgi:hypothetical protein
VGDVTADLEALIDALRHVVETFNAAAATASYVLETDGALLTLQVTAGGLVTIADDDGNLVAVPEGGS